LMAGTRPTPSSPTTPPNNSAPPTPIRAVRKLIAATRKSRSPAESAHRPRPACAGVDRALAAA
jgi:hypothetical protein